MKSKLIVESAFSPSRSGEPFWLYAATVIVNLADTRRRIISHDFTPPPFRGKLMECLHANGAKYKEHADAVGIEFTTASQIVACTKLINWSSSLVLRLEMTGLEQASVPEIKRRLLVRRLDEWYESREDLFPALCYIGISPFPALEVVANDFSHEDLLAAHKTAMNAAGFSMETISITTTVVASGNAARGEPKSTGGGEALDGFA